MFPLFLLKKSEQVTPSKGTDLDPGENLALKSQKDAEQVGAKPRFQTTREMDRSLLDSVAWNTVSDWTSQILTWAAFLLVLRFVGPADFGIVGMTVVLMPLAYTATFGIGRAVVTLDLTDNQVAQLNTLGLVLGLGSFAIAAALAEPIAWFFKTPRLALVIVLSSSSFIVTGASVVSNATLMKKFRIRALVIVNAVVGLVGAAIQLFLAWRGWGYWALVLGSLVMSTVRGVAVLWLEPQAYATPRWDSIRKPLAFSGHFIFSQFVSDIYESLDNFTVAKVLGSAALGLYGIAWTVAHVPVEKVTSMVTTVVANYFVAVKDNLGAVRRYLRNLTQGIALLTFPACVGVGMVARELVLLVLGRKWEGAIGPLRVLSIYAAFRSIVALLPKILVSFGDARFVMWNSLAMLLVLGPAFYVGSHWGTTGVAWAWVVAYPWVVLFLYREVFKKIEMGVAEYIGSLRPALEGTVVMALAVGCVGYAISSDQSVLLRLIVKVAVGVTAYAGVLSVRHRQRMAAWVELARNFRRGQA